MPVWREVISIGIPVVKWPRRMGNRGAALVRAGFYPRNLQKKVRS